MTVTVNLLVSLGLGVYSYLHSYDLKYYLRFGKKKVFFLLIFWGANRGQCSLWWKKEAVLHLQLTLCFSKMQKLVNMLLISSLKFLFVHLLINFIKNLLVAKCQLCSAYILAHNKPEPSSSFFATQSAFTSILDPPCPEKGESKIRLLNC